VFILYDQVLNDSQDSRSKEVLNEYNPYDIILLSIPTINVFLFSISVVLIIWRLILSPSLSGDWH
jgi:hypothetical protein